MVENAGSLFVISDLWGIVLESYRPYICALLQLVSVGLPVLVGHQRPYVRLFTRTDRKPNLSLLVTELCEP